jgi:hypothetical protein
VVEILFQFCLVPPCNLVEVDKRFGGQFNAKPNESLQRKAIGFYETSVDFCRTTRHHNPESNIPNSDYIFSY